VPPAVGPLITPLAPAGTTEAAGALEAAPGLIRIGDMMKKRRECMEDVLNDGEFQDMEGSKETHGGKF
jgi:hypothetical protein